MQSSNENITSLLNRMRQGDAGAADEAMRAIYGELRRVAGRCMSQEHAGHTLQPTALVNEAMIRLMGGGPLPIADRKHFLAMSAQAMRRVLVDHAREKGASKRGGSAVKVEIEDGHAVSASRQLEVLEMDEALRTLAKLDARAAEVVELRFFGGYQENEICEILNENLATVRRDWEFAKAWLRSRLRS